MRHLKKIKTVLLNYNITTVLCQVHVHAFVQSFAVTSAVAEQTCDGSEDRERWGWRAPLTNKTFHFY